MSSRWLLPLIVLSLTACAEDPNSALRALDSPRQPGEVLQDLRDDGARMFSTVQPVPPFSDAPRTLIARWIDPKGRENSSWAFDGVPVFDIRLVPGSEAVVAITSRRELVVIASHRESPTPIDSQAHAPLSLSRDGRYVAFARGEIPDLEIVCYDLVRKARVAATQNMAPAWSPVLSDDGSRLLFVSGSTGHPELWELRDDQSVVQRTDRMRDPVPFPSGPSAPIWNRDGIVFEDPDGVHLLSLDPPKLLRSLPGSLPIVMSRSRGFVVQDPEGRPPRWESFEGKEAAR
jgi:hypothetical protein